MISSYPHIVNNPSDLAQGLEFFEFLKDVKFFQIRETLYLLLIDNLRQRVGPTDVIFPVLQSNPVLQCTAASVSLGQFQTETDSYAY